MTPRRVGIIGLGEVGLVLAQDLLKRGNICVQVWDWQFDDRKSSASAHLAEISSQDKLLVADEAGVALQQCDVVFCAVTAEQAVAAARASCKSLEPGALYFDLNSVSPRTKQEVGDLIGDAGGRFVEAAIMSPIHPSRTSAPILLSGPASAKARVVGEDLGFCGMEAISTAHDKAAATKMCRSVIIKGMEALITESLLAARYYGVEQSVIASLENLLPGPYWPDHARYLVSRTLHHGTRRAEEMREVAKTVREAGVEPWMSVSCEKRQAWAAQHRDALEKEHLGEMLDAIRKHSPRSRVEQIS